MNYKIGRSGEEFALLNQLFFAMSLREAHSRRQCSVWRCSPGCPLTAALLWSWLDHVLVLSCYLRGDYSRNSGFRIWCWSTGCKNELKRSIEVKSQKDLGQDIRESVLVEQQTQHGHSTDTQGPLSSGRADSVLCSSLSNLPDCWKAGKYSVPRDTSQQSTKKVKPGPHLCIYLGHPMEVILLMNFYWG